MKLQGLILAVWERKRHQSSGQTHKHLFQVLQGDLQGMPGEPGCGWHVTKLERHCWSAFSSHPNPYLRIQLAPLQATGKLTERYNNNLSVLDFAAPELFEGACHGFVGSASCRTWAGAGTVARGGLWGEIAVSATVNCYSTDSVILYHQSVWKPLYVQQFFLESYSLWFSQWYPFAFRYLRVLCHTCTIPVFWRVGIACQG